MLFPGWANAQENVLRTKGWDGNTYTVTQDSFLIGLSSESGSSNPAYALINGERLFRGNTTDTSTAYTSYPCFYYAKGTVLKNDGSDNAVFKVIPLVKSGVGLESALIILSCTKANQRRRPYVIK